MKQVFTPRGNKIKRTIFVNAQTLLQVIWAASPHFQPTKKKKQRDIPPCTCLCTQSLLSTTVFFVHDCFHPLFHPHVSFSPLSLSLDLLSLSFLCAAPDNGELRPHRGRKRRRREKRRERRKFTRPLCPPPPLLPPPPPPLLPPPPPFFFPKKSLLPVSYYLLLLLQ